MLAIAGKGECGRFKVAEGLIRVDPLSVGDVPEDEVAAHTAACQRLAVGGEGDVDGGAGPDSQVARAFAGSGVEHLRGRVARDHELAIRRKRDIGFGVAAGNFPAQRSIGRVPEADEIDGLEGGRGGAILAAGGGQRLAVGRERERADKGCAAQKARFLTRLDVPLEEGGVAFVNVARDRAEGNALTIGREGEGGHERQGGGEGLHETM